MRDYVAEMNDTAMLLRKYMNQQRPQSFAAVFDLAFPDNEILTKVLIQKILKWMEEHKEATV